MALPSHCPELPPPAALPPCCRDLAEWPQSWMGDERDLVPGQQIVQYLTPFLLYLAKSGLTKRTVQKHVDNLWALGGEIIRDLQDTPKLRKKPVTEIVDTLLENDGPLLYHCDSQEQQRSFSSTCRKLRRYLNRSLTGA